MDIKQKVIGVLAYALIGIASPGFAADKADSPSGSFKTVPFQEWIKVDVFPNDEKDANEKACSLEVFKNAFPDAEKTDEAGKVRYNGVSDIVYMTAFNNDPYVLLVQACGADPKKFDGSTWSFPGGRNDKSYPTVAALREGEEETAKFFGFPSNEAELSVASKNMMILHLPNPHPRFKGSPMSLAIAPVGADLNWSDMVHNFKLASQGYENDMKEKGRPAPHHEKQNGAWVLMEDVLKLHSHGIPSDHIAGSFTVYNPVERNPEQRDLLIRKSGIFPFLTFQEVRDALANVSQKTAPQPKG